MLSKCRCVNGGCKSNNRCWVFLIIPFYLTISFFLTVLTQSKRYVFFMPTLPCLVSFCQAFPPLYEDIMSLLIQIGQVCASDVATQTRDFDPIITRKEMTLYFQSDLVVPGRRLGQRFSSSSAVGIQREICCCCCAKCRRNGNRWIRWVGGESSEAKGSKSTRLVKLHVIV